ncbi:DUF952 domain-containing protein [Planctomycetales bacterium 10988]|nr:DUF952 domain-containing protein [Planctomycetales bacterium 10988]
MKKTFQRTSLLTACCLGLAALFVLPALTLGDAPKAKKMKKRPDNKAPKGFVALFDGKSLDGWTKEGGYAEYKVEEGTMVGTTAEGSKNTFLTKGPYSDFILEFDVKCDVELNSGVQVRSHTYKEDTPQASKPAKIREAGEVYGYQCEICESSRGTAGNFWDEGRWTRWHDDFAEKPEAQQAFKDGEWNHYKIVAQGNRIRSWINGVPCADFKDDMDATGFLGFQVHGIKPGSGPYSVRWKNIYIHELQPGEKVNKKGNLVKGKKKDV